MAGYGSDWSDAEVAATVDAYLQMLKMELSGEPYSKKAENEALRSQLDGRTPGAVEFKHQNISAVLLENGWLFIEGYKPLKNVQARLRHEVESRLRLDGTLDGLMEAATEFLPQLPSTDLGAPVPPPEFVLGTSQWKPSKTGIKRDYVFRDARNRALGLAGESAVVKFEKSRLGLAGRQDLAARVEHVAVTQGDGLGYDVLSFEKSGAERFIEVKTTLYSIETPFFISAKEVEASDFYGDQYSLYRLYRFAGKRGHYALSGPMRGSCQLVAENFLAAPSLQT